MVRTAPDASPGPQRRVPRVAKSGHRGRSPATITGRPTLFPRYYGGYGTGDYYGGYANRSYVTGRPTLFPRYY